MSNFKLLFKKQIERLEKSNCPEYLVELAIKFESDVLQRARDMWIGSGNIPFIPIVPSSGLISLVDLNGYQLERPKQKEEIVYYIFDVNTKDFIGKPASFYKKIAKKQGRSLLTFNEAVSLNVQEELVSWKRFVICGASSFKDSPNEIPMIYKSSRESIIEVGKIKSWDNCQFCITPTKSP